MLKIRSLACVVILALSGTASTSPQGGLFAGISPDMPPMPLWGQGQSAAYWESGMIRTVVSYSALDSSVTVDRIYSPSVIPSETIARTSQRFPTSYWPTALRAIDQSRILVAGKSKRAPFNTVLELWTFSAGGNVPAPSPFTSTTTGQTYYQWSLPAIQSVEELYRAAVPARNVISAIFVNRGIATGDSLILQFFDSKDIYSFSLQTASLQLVASPANAAAPLVQPALTQDCNTFWAADHSTLGLVYALQVKDPIPGQSVTSLLLRDSDRNGTMDSLQAYSMSQWATAGLADPSAFLHHYY